MIFMKFDFRIFFLTPKLSKTRPFTKRSTKKSINDPEQVNRLGLT